MNFGERIWRVLSELMPCKALLPYNPMLGKTKQKIVKYPKSEFSPFFENNFEPFPGFMRDLEVMNFLCTFRGGVVEILHSISSNVSEIIKNFMNNQTLLYLKNPKQDRCLSTNFDANLLGSFREIGFCGRMTRDDGRRP